MKTAFILSIIFCFSMSLFGQQKKSTESFIIKGQIMLEDISQYKLISDKVRIDYYDEFDQIHSDSSNMSEEGNFYIDTHNIVKPVRISLIFDFDAYQDILAAPGYELTFYRPSKFKQEFKLTGNGSRASKYYKILDSIPSSRYYAISWWDLNETGFISRINKTLATRDSVSNAVFGRNAGQDKYFDYFGKMTRFDNKFEKLKYLFLYAKHNKYSVGKTISFVRNNFDADFFKDFSKEEYLISPEFRSCISSHRPDSFLNYLLIFNDPTSSPADIENLFDAYLLEKANTVFNGAVKALALFKIMEFPIWKYKSIVELNKYRNQLKPYLSSLTDSAMKELDNVFNEKIKRLAIVEGELSKKEIDHAESFVGKPAPPFSLKDKYDTQYSLADFKDKVVILDLWSSWSNLCGIENKALKKVYRKFSGISNLVFIGINVLGTSDEWLNALKTDRPIGIQLFDNDKVVFDSYIDERIPKFVVIDRQGKVASFTAPNPSDGDKLEKLIWRELEKKAGEFKIIP
jgi:peroxiredoxin